MAAGGGGWGGIVADVPVFEAPDEPGAAAGNAAGETLHEMFHEMHEVVAKNLEGGMKAFQYLKVCADRRQADPGTDASGRHAPLPPQKLAFDDGTDKLISHEAFTLHGNTYHHRKEIKALGAVYVGKQHGRTAPSSDTLGVAATVNYRG